MHTKVLVLSLVLLTQACGTILGQTTAPEQTDSPGMLQKLVERAREAQTKVQGLGSSAVGFFGAYYEDHIQPRTDSFTEWAADVRSSVWEKIQTTVDNYMPFTTTNGTDHT